MAQVFHGNVCRALLVFLLCSVEAVFDLDSKFDMEGESSVEPCFDEMVPSRGWCFLILPSELLVSPFLGDWFSTPVVTPSLHECDLQMRLIVGFYSSLPLTFRCSRLLVMQWFAPSPLLDWQHPSILRWV